MLKIRKEQMDVFSQIAARNFEDQMVEYIQGAFPKAYSDLKEARIREIIRYGWNKAKGYGIKSERGVRLYISLIFLLGCSYDVDPQLPWAGEILKDENVADEAAKIDKLYEKSMNYYYQAAGADGENIDEAMNRIRYERLEDSSISRNISGDSSAEFESQMATRLKRIFPEKYEYVGENCISQLIQFGIESAGRYGITTERGVTIYIGMMFMLGCGFDTDLKFPWAAEILNDKNNIDKKADQLYAKAIALMEERLS